MLWMMLSPFAQSAARSRAMPARMSGLEISAPVKRLPPTMMARCGSHSTMRAPIWISLSVKKRRDSNIFSKIITVPSDCAPTTTMIDKRSAGEGGQGAASVVRPARHMAEGEVAPGQRLHAADGQRVRGNAVDLRAEGVEKSAEVLDVRLRGGVVDERVAVGQDGGHDGVLRGGDGGLVEEHLPPDEGARAHAVLVRGDFDLGA